jgi:hypothetical protein
MRAQSSSLFRINHVAQLHSVKLLRNDTVEVDK